MAKTAIENVPPSIERLSQLLQFDLRECERLKSLPTNFFKIKSLQELYLQGCLGLEYLPEMFEPMEHLEVFEIQKAGIRQLPLSIENLVKITHLKLQNTSVTEIIDWVFYLPALESLHLSETDIIRIPESIKLSKLRILSIRNCKFLQSLPELPLSIEVVNARGCTSLEMVSNSWSLLAHGHKRDMCLRERFSFDGCLKFDPKNILTEFQIRALSLASILALLRHKGWLKLADKNIITEFEVARTRTELCQQFTPHSRNGACLEVSVRYTGDQIPEWFSHQNVGCSISMKPPPLQCSPQNFMGFAFCFVVENFGNDQNKNPQLDWKIHLKTNDNCERCHRFVLWTALFRSRYELNHVVMATYLDTGAVDLNSVKEMSFHFHLRDPLKRKIKSCGIRMLFFQDAFEFGIIGDQHVFGKSNVVTNRKQPSGFWKNVLYPLLSFEVFPSRKQLCEKILSLKMQQRHKELWLLLVWDILPVRQVLSRQIDVVDTTCPLCGFVLESATHLFLYCQSVRPLWFMSQWGLRTDFLFCYSMASFLEVVLFGDPNSDIYHFDREFLHYASVLVDAIWLARNELVHKDEAFRIADIHSSVQAEFNDMIQLDVLDFYSSVSKASVRDSDTAETNPKRTHQQKKREKRKEMLREISSKQKTNAKNPKRAKFSN